MKSVLIFCLMAGIMLVSAQAQDKSQTAIADSLFEHYQEEKALNAYNTILETDPDNFSALWHSSLLYSRIGNQQDDDEAEEKRYFNLAKERAQKALDVDAVHTQANFVMAVAMGRMALIGSARERVAASRDIKRYADRSLQADSSNAGAWHVLGRWNVEISNLNFAERLAANVLFGGIPDGASTEKGVKYIEKAIDLNPDFILYYYDLANAFEELGKDEKAIAACRTGLEKPVQAPGDEQIKSDCRALIDDLN